MMGINVKSMAAILIAMLACGCHHNSKQQQVLSFENDAVQAMPCGWKVAETNSSNHPAVWEVIQDDRAVVGRQVLAITETTNKGNTYNLLISDQVNLADVLKLC